MNVNEARRDDTVASVDGSARGQMCQSADAYDLAIFDGDIAACPTVTGAVNDAPVGDQQISRA